MMHTLIHVMIHVNEYLVEKPLHVGETHIYLIQIDK